MGVLSTFTLHDIIDVRTLQVKLCCQISSLEKNKDVRDFVGSGNLVYVVMVILIFNCR